MEKLGQPIVFCHWDQSKNDVLLLGKNWASPFFPHPEKWKHQHCADGYLGGEKWAGSFFPHPDYEKINLTLSWICIQPLLFRGWGKTGPAHSFPTLTIKHQPCAGDYLGGEKLGWSILFPPWQVKASTLPCHEYAYNLCFLGGGKKLGRPILSPPWLVKVSTLPCHEYANNLCFLRGGENWAGPFFPHPDKIKHQPCADGYLGREKLGWSILFPPWS